MVAFQVIHETVRVFLAIPLNQMLSSTLCTGISVFFSFEIDLEASGDATAVASIGTSENASLEALLASSNAAGKWSAISLDTSIDSLGVSRNDPSADVIRHSSS